MRIAYMILISLFFLTGCSETGYNSEMEESTNSYNIRPEFSNGLTQIKKSSGEVIDMEVEIADSPQERAYGLMFLENLDSTKGMYFMFNDSQELSFWMKNTLIPLDMIFIDENNLIVDIKKDAPPCEIDNCPTYPSKKKAKYVLEVNAGFSSLHGIKEGDNIFIVVED